MGTLIIVIRFIHIVSAVGMVIGLVGRELARSQGRRATDIQQLVVWVRRSGYFENLLVIPGSQVVIGAGIVLAWLQGWPVFGFLQGARANWLLASVALTFLMAVIIVKIFIPRGKVFAQRLTHAIAQGRITSELMASFRDPVVAAAHVVEMFVMVATMYLMVAKPF